MKRDEFAIGAEFWTRTGRWRCTDVGSRVITAIKLDREDPTWYHGPPYAVAEHVFDENDQQACYATLADYEGSASHSDELHDPSASRARM